MHETTEIPHEIQNKEIVYQDKHRKIQKVVAKFTNFDKEYLVSDSGERVGIVVVHDRLVLLTKQYRLLTNQITLEIPGGKVDEGENPLDAAVRECFEETGVTPNSPNLLIDYFPGLDIAKNHTWIYVSDGIISEKALDSDTKVWIDIDECFQMAIDGKLQDALTMIGILSYFGKRKNI